MRYKWAVVLMLWTICFCNYADRQAIFSVFPLLERELHLTTVQLGLLGSAFAWVYGLAAPLAGMVVDLHRDGLLAHVPAAVLLPRGRRARRNLLLPRVDVAHQRLSRPRHAVARDGTAPDQRVPRHDRRRLLCRPDRPVLRLAAVVRRVRQRRHPARLRAAA